MKLVHLPKNTRALVTRTQDAIEQRVQVGQDTEFVQPSRFWLKATAWTLMGTTLFGVGWLAVAQTEEIVVSQGKLEPLGEVKPIQVPLGGVVEEILVKEGEKVKAGQVLLRMDTEATSEKERSLRESLQLKEEQLALKQQEKQATLEANRTYQGVLERNLKLQQEVEKRLRFLQKEGAGSEIQSLQQTDKVQQVSGELAKVRAEGFRELKQLDQQISLLKSELSQLRSSLTEQQVNMRYRTITAPVDGVVFELKPKTSGFVAQSSEPVMRIVPFDKLKARVEIPSGNIGFVKVGQAADLSIDSFPATDFGVLEGKVKTIGSDALPPDPQQGRTSYSFPADIQLSSQQLKLKNGDRLPLQVGMSLTANIKLRKVSYLQLLLGSFRDKTSSLREI